jgi:hypothetical protein
MKFVLENLDKKWIWWGLSRNPGITMKDILENPNLPWDWDYISENHRYEKSKKSQIEC